MLVAPLHKKSRNCWGELFQSPRPWRAMTRTAKPLTLLLALLLVAVPYATIADDSDGDGVDDALDDFPNNPCADTDTDGDGLPDSVVAGCTYSSTVAYTSFEDPFTIASVKYTDTGNESVSRYLWNNANEPHIAHNQTNGSEMGFTLYYTSTGGSGLTDGDYFGTINYTGTVGNFSDGNNGYQMSDVDGIATLALDDITADEMSFDFFLQDTGYETSNPVDYLVIRFIGANNDIEMINTTGYDIDTDNSSWLGTWTTMTVMVGAAGHGHLEVEFSSNSAMEALYLDNIVFTQDVTMTEDLDDDNDGWSDLDEVDCGTDSTDSNDVPADADNNGICDALEGDDYDGDGIPNDSDPDDDNDGVDDTEDDFPLNSNEWEDTDGDGLGNNADDDDDDDGYTDVNEADCGSDSLDDTSIPTDTDGDGVCNALDADDDNDGVLDDDDPYPEDSNEWEDTDGDGIGDNADTDDDNDGWSDSVEDDCLSDSVDANSLPTDTDGDGTCDPLDHDDDGDGHLDDVEIDCGSDATDSGSVPDDFDSDGVCDTRDEDDDDDGYEDAVEQACNSDSMDSNSVPIDSDGDGTCDSQDNDLDNDGVDDVDDAFPNDPNESSDNDGDGTGDNADTDDDDDSVTDSMEDDCGSDPLDSNSLPVDTDSDGDCDSIDVDDDGDGVEDSQDDFPTDSNEWTDDDGDGTGDNADTDDDNDGWPDSVEEECGSNTKDSDSEPADLDEDGMCDLQDPDDDGDGFADDGDAFPADSSEWSDFDSDGTGDNSDWDDDGDGFTDDDEKNCNSDSMDSNSVPEDIDGDGVCDEMDSDNTDGPNYVEADETPGFGVILGTLAILCAAMFVGRRQQ